jgi:hypothetical protein
MGVITFLVVVVAVVVGLVLVVGVLSGASTIGQRSNRELRNTKYQLKAARKALYAIASGNSGNPTLEAQIALDEIDRKELEA